MKILDILNEGATWTGNAWIGGASDEGHPDFDPLQFGNYGYRNARRQAPSRPQNPYRNVGPDPFVAVKVPYAVKDAFKEVLGKGNYAWDGDHKTWKVRSSKLTMEMKKRLHDMGIEVPR